MANFIGLVYGTLKAKGIDTSKMSTEEAIAKFNEINKEEGGGNKPVKADSPNAPKDTQKNNSKNNENIIVNKKQVLDYEPTQNNEITFSSSKVIKDLFNLEEEDFENKIKNMSGDLWKSQTQDELLKSVLKEKGFLGKPKIVNDKIFDELLESGANVIYRGVNKKNYSDELKYNDDVFIGRGATTNGLWFAHDKKEAESFATQNGSVATAILSPNAKIGKLSFDDIANFKFDEEYEGSNLSADRRLSMIKNGKAGTIPILLALKGYDAVDVGHNNLVILNRTALLMRETDN